MKAPVLHTRRFVGDVRDMLVPHRASRHGPLPPLLVAMTFVSGLVDAFSYLLLGHVFVANMTGNVVFLGFALAGAKGFSVAASLVALGSYVGGALVGGRVVSGLGHHRGHLLAATAALQSLLLGVSVIVAAAGGDPVAGGCRYALIVVLGVAMGIQNATARKLAVPDLTTTTVLTSTITGVAADSAIAGGAGSAAGRRLVAVSALLTGALAGAALALHVERVSPLAVALAVIAVVALVSWRAGAADPDWVRPI